MTRDWAEDVLVSHRKLGITIGHESCMPSRELRTHRDDRLHEDLGESRSAASVEQYDDANLDIIFILLGHSIAAKEVQSLSEPFQLTMEHGVKGLLVPIENLRYFRYHRRHHGPRGSCVIAAIRSQLLSRHWGVLVSTLAATSATLFGPQLSRRA